MHTKNQDLGIKFMMHSSTEQVGLEEANEKAVTNLEDMPFKTQCTDLCHVPEMFCGLLFFFCHLLELNDGLLANVGCGDFSQM